MQIKGKQTDTFEMSIKQLFEVYGGIPVRYIDCASCRCFAFQMGSAVKDWFSPLIRVREAVDRLSWCYGIPLVCERLEGGSFRGAHEPIVLGPLKVGMAVPEHRDYYYNGQGHYICIMECENQREYMVFDPCGLAGVAVREEILYSIADNETWMIYCKALPTKWRMLDAGEVFEQGLAFRKVNRIREQDTMKSAMDHYVAGKANKIALRYAVLNLVTQLDKVCELAIQSSLFDDVQYKQYLRYKCLLYQKAECEEIKQIQMVFDDVWELFEDAGKI